MKKYKLIKFHKNLYRESKLWKGKFEEFYLTNSLQDSLGHIRKLRWVVSYNFSNPNE
jgi:hypothetical protein